jgi:hypothetical protein
MSLNDEQKLAAEKSLRPNANNEIDYFALGDSFAHIRPTKPEKTISRAFSST